MATDNSSAYRLSETFVKKLVGRTDIEDALQRLEKVAVEEARTAAAEALKAISDIGDKVENEAQGIHDAVKAFEGKIEGMIQGVGNLVQGVDDRVRNIGDMVIAGAQ
jgi:predicted transcriptional regulator